MYHRTRAFLLAAGLGTRLRPLTDWAPKCLTTIAGRPLLSWWIDLLGQAGIQDALINTHSHASRIRDFIHQNNSSSVVHLHESYEPFLRGSAGAVTANASWANNVDDIVLINADNFTNVDLRKLLAFHRSHSDPVTMMLYRAPDPRACGIATLDGTGRVVAFTEKPQQPRSNLANAGVYVVRAEAFREIARMAAFDLGHDVLPRFVGRMQGWLWDGYLRDVGTPEALDRARQEAPGLKLAGQHIRPRSLPAVFLDRDGTLIEDVPYLHDPSQVRLLPGVAEAVHGLRSAGYPCVVVTNQSGIGRGLFGVTEMQQVNAEMRRQLVAAGTDLDGLYHCPVAPTNSDRTTIDCHWRKPGPGMLQQAAHDLELNLGESWMIGDMISDVLAGCNAGCRGSVLLGSESEKTKLTSVGGRGVLLEDLPAAARFVLAGWYTCGTTVN